MIDTPNINESTPNSNKIVKDDYNKIIEIANRYKNLSIGSSSIDNSINSIDGVGYVNADTEETDYPFRTELAKGTSLSIVKGDWKSNEVTTTLEASATATESTLNPSKLNISIDDFTGTLAEDKDFYVYVKHSANSSSTTLDFDPSIIPGKLEVFVTDDREEAGEYTPEEAYTNIIGGAENRDFFVKDKEIIAVVQLKSDGGSGYFLKSVEQRINEDIINTQTLVDSMAEDDTEASHARKSIGVNNSVDEDYDGTIHYGELQINQINYCAGESSYSVPTFYSSETNNTLVGPSGEVVWSAIDSNYFPLGSQVNHETIDVWIDQNSDNKPIDDESWSPLFNGNNFKVIGLHNATVDPDDGGPPENSHCMGYILSTTLDGGDQMRGELKWASLDYHLQDANVQRSLQVIEGSSGYDIVQIYNFEDGTGPVGVLGDNDKVLIRDSDGGTGGPSVVYASKNDILNWLDVENVYYAEYAGYAYDAAHATCADEICDPDSWSGHPHSNHSGLSNDDHPQYLKLNGNQSRNAMSGVIGDSSGTLVINPGARLLYSGVSFSWTIDWNNGMMRGGSQEASLDWFNKILYDGAAKCLEWGIGAGENILGNRYWTVTDTTEAGAGTGALVVDGGISVAKRIRTESTTDATAGDGALISLGGASIAKKLRIEDTTEAGAGDGALISLGGLYTAKKIYAVDDIRTDGDYYQGTNQGETGQGFSGGIMVDLSAAETATVSQTYDLMVGWGLL